MSFVFQIDTDIAPVSNKRGRKATEFPLDQLEIGHSFLIPIAEETDEATKKAVESWRRKLRVSIVRFNEQYEGKFVTAMVAEGLRVWRSE